MKKSSSFLDLLITEHYLIKILVQRDIASQFAGSSLGVVWSLIHPVRTLFIYWLVFSIGFKIQPENNIPYIVWFAVGMTIWFFFSDAVNGAASSIVTNSFLIKKTICSPQILPVVKIVSGLVVHLVFLGIISVLIAFYQLPFNIFFFQCAYYLFCLIVFSMGVGLLASSLNIFFRDLSHIIRIFLQLLFWVTPIVWDLKMMPGSIQFFFKLNPLYYIVQGYRDSLIYFIPFWHYPEESAYFWAIALSFFFGGAFVFNRLRPQFADLL
jgi:ABC-type polysaccharide/polyol phosphate export permease